jgi:DNA transformation protein
MTVFARNRALLDLPNVSVLLSEALQGAGIRDANTLCTAGAEKSWLQLHQHPVHSSPQCLLALEGAIHGVDWHDIPYQRRLELERFALEHGARSGVSASLPRPS